MLQAQTEPNNGTAVIYARFSSAKQQEQSIEAQLRYCREWATRRGFNVVGEYCDRAISGRDAETRPAFQRMVADAKKHAFQVVVVWKLDRFSRNRYDSIIYKRKLQQSGVRVMSATEPVGSEDDSPIIEALLEAMAEEYSRQLAQNVSRGMRETARKGNFTGGSIPLGYRVEDKKLVVEEAEACVVREIFQRYADGTPKAKIISWLNEAGHRTRSGDPHTLASLNRMLSNKKYTGVFTYDDIEVPGGCPAIVSEELFQAVARRTAAARRAPAHGKAKEEYLLAGKVFCGHCGAPMVGESGKGKGGTVYHYYACADKKKHHTCDKKNEKKAFLEGYAVDQAVSYVLAPENLHRIAVGVAKSYAKSCDNSSMKAVEREIRKLDKELDKLVDALVKTSVQRALDKINQQMELLEAQRKELEDELAGMRLAAKHPMTAAQVETWLRQYCTGDLSDPEFRRHIIDVLINSIYVFDDKIVCYFNLTDSAQVTFAEMQDSLAEASECSDLTSCGSPKKESTLRWVLFLHSDGDSKDFMRQSGGLPLRPGSTGRTPLFCEAKCKRIPGGCRWDESPAGADGMNPRQVPVG